MCLSLLQVSAPDPSDPTVMRTDFWMPCSPGAPGATEKNWVDIEPHQLWEEPVSMRDMEASLTRSKPSVNTNDMEKMTQFTRDFGSEG